jgi:hypothetical protein
MDQDEKYKQELAKLMLNAVHSLDLSIPGNEELLLKYTLDFLKQHEAAHPIFEVREIEYGAIYPILLVA